MKTLAIGYSTCPNDTFIFAELGYGPPGSLSFRPVLADVETLNQWALEGRLDVTKVSFLALGRVREAYGLLYAGAALGHGCGPILVGRPGTGLGDVGRAVVAAPGELTTARLLLGLYLKREPSLRQMVFSEVMPAVARGEADFGLVIHEGRFTFRQYGLEILLDLGEWWESETGRPIPLGGIAIRRDLDREVAVEVDRAIRASLRAARAGSPRVMEYVLAHAQEMSAEVVKQHIDLYVNDFSYDLGGPGLEAADLLLRTAEEAGLVPRSALPLMAYEEPAVAEASPPVQCLK
jgi:1,4-dihydroxy-6-naphthoate synthase